jgi:hypothetical protein
MIRDTIAYSRLTPQPRAQVVRSVDKSYFK